MSRKIFGLFDKKAKTISYEDEATGSSFERRVSVSNSGRWKQKNKQRSIVSDDIFKPKQDSESDKPVKKELPAEKVTQDDKKGQTPVKNHEITPETKVDEKKIVFETSL